MPFDQTAVRVLRRRTVRNSIDGSYFERPRGLKPAARWVCRLALGELARLRYFPKGQEHALVGPQGVNRLAEFVELAG